MTFIVNNQVFQLFQSINLYDDNLLKIQFISLELIILASHGTRLQPVSGKPKRKKV